MKLLPQVKLGRNANAAKCDNSIEILSNWNIFVFYSSCAIKHKNHFNNDNRLTAASQPIVIIIIKHFVRIEIIKCCAAIRHVHISIHWHLNEMLTHNRYRKTVFQLVEHWNWTDLMLLYVLYALRAAFESIPLLLNNTQNYNIFFFIFSRRYVAYTHSQLKRTQTTNSIE